MIAYHDALDSTKICAEGRMVGESIRVPRVTWAYLPSRTIEKSNDPTCFTASVVVIGVAKDQQIIAALVDVELIALDACEGLER